jgi:hypothetical protein
MATVVSSYLPYMYHQQPYYYPTLPSVSSPPFAPNNYYSPPPPPQQQQYQQRQPQQQQPQQQQTTKVQYVDSNSEYIHPRREPRIYRQVILLPTPEPVYRQVRHRMPTPERQVIKRTITQKANGTVVVQQQRPTTKPRSQSRVDSNTQTRSSRSRQVHTD